MNSLKISLFTRAGVYMTTAECRDCQLFFEVGEDNLEQIRTQKFKYFSLIKLMVW